VVKLADTFGNGIPGTPVTFSDGSNGSFSANPVNTDTLGTASDTYTLPTVAKQVTIKATAAGLTLNFTEKPVAAAPASVTIATGNNQTAAPNTLLPSALAVLVKDQYGNPVSGVSVGFADGGAGGTLSSPTATTGSTGKASVTYTTPSQTGNVTITASVSGLTPVLFSEHVH
jgi:adhesin/invasin